MPEIEDCIVNVCGGCPDAGRNISQSYTNTNADGKPLKTVFSIAICRPSSDSQKLCLETIFYLRPSLVLTFSIGAYPV